MSKKMQAQTLTQESQELLKKANQLPGAASLMRLYSGFEKVQAEYYRCLHNVAPFVTSQASSSAVPDFIQDDEDSCQHGQE